MGKISDHISRSFQTFCDGTSLHGFMELHHAKNTSLKLFWVTLLTSALGLTTYQVTIAVIQYRNQETNSRNEPILKNDMYPPIKLCMQHWMYWLDWEKAFSLNFTKQSILYGMSFLTDIYISEAFEFETAKKEFNAAMVLNNFLKIQQFYKGVAKRFPFAVNTPNNSLMMFQEISMFNSIYQGLLLCYVTSGETVLKIVNDRSIDSFPELFFNVKPQTYSSVSQYITLSEYQWYVTQWVLSTGNYVRNDELENFSALNMYLLLFIDGYSQDYAPIAFESDFYTITAFVNANRWKSSSDYKCTVGERMIRTDLSICYQCKFIYEDTVCTCRTLESAVPAEKDYPDSVCKMKIYNLFSDEKQPRRIVSESDVQSNVDELYCMKNETAVELQKSCIERCVLPCEDWSYTFTFVTENTGASSLVKAFTKLSISIHIVYPHEENIFIMVEVDRQTWGDFVANIGGLLGVWTGASLLSIVQLFYLCCFSHIEPKRILKKKANHNIMMAENYNTTKTVNNEK